MLQVIQKEAEDLATVGRLLGPCYNGNEVAYVAFLLVGLEELPEGLVECIFASVRLARALVPSIKFHQALVLCRCGLFLLRGRVRQVLAGVGGESFLLLHTGLCCFESLLKETLLIL